MRQRTTRDGGMISRVPELLKPRVHCMGQMLGEVGRGR